MRERTTRGGVANYLGRLGLAALLLVAGCAANDSATVVSPRPPSAITFGGNAEPTAMAAPRTPVRPRLSRTVTLGSDARSGARTYLLEPARRDVAGAPSSPLVRAHRFSEWNDPPPFKGYRYLPHVTNRYGSGYRIHDPMHHPVDGFRSRR